MIESPQLYDLVLLNTERSFQAIETLRGQQTEHLAGSRRPQGHLGLEERGAPASKEGLVGL